MWCLFSFILETKLVFFNFTLFSSCQKKSRHFFFTFCFAQLHLLILDSKTLFCACSLTLQLLTIKQTVYKQSELTASFLLIKSLPEWNHSQGWEWVFWLVALLECKWTPILRNAIFVPQVHCTPRYTFVAIGKFENINWTYWKLLDQWTAFMWLVSNQKILKLP